MYAIIQTGGHQVKVTPGGVATLYGTAGEPGAELTLDQVLVVGHGRARGPGFMWW